MSNPIEKGTTGRENTNQSKGTEKSQQESTSKKPGVRE